MSKIAKETAPGLRSVEASKTTCCLVRSIRAWRVRVR